MNYSSLNQLGILALASVLVTACNDGLQGSQDTVASAALPPSSAPEKVTTNPPEKLESTPVNQPPSISGAAQSQATVDQQWSFRPTISDPDGDRLNVTASNLPAWISVNNSSGMLSGTPTEADVQTWSGITVSVSDGSAAASLPAFSVNVLAPNAATGSATLSWLPPTQDVDGSPVGGLSGYRVLYGQTSLDYDQAIAINNPGITRYMIEGLSSGDWYFAIQAVDADGLVSEPSAEAQKSI